MTDKTDNFRNSRHVVYELYAWIALTPKYRHLTITSRASQLIEETSQHVCKNLGAELLQFNINHDHIQLLVSYPPKLAVSTLIMRLKTVTALRLKQQHWEEIDSALSDKHFWSSSYAVASAGAAPAAIIDEYIHNQQTQ